MKEIQEDHKVATMLTLQRCKESVGSHAKCHTFQMQREKKAQNDIKHLN